MPNKTTTIKVAMEWNAPAKKWLQRIAFSQIFLYDYWNCGSVIKVFKKLNKLNPQVYKITVEWLGNEITYNTKEAPDE